MVDLPRQMRAWQQPQRSGVADIIKQYERGFAGCFHDQEAEDELASYGAASGEDVCSALGYEDSAAGEIVVPFLHVVEAYPNAYPGPGQKRGSCVAHCGRNAGLLTLVCDVVGGEPDPASGFVEECPEVSSSGERAGVLAIEPMYHHRGHNGDGWFCPGCANVMVKSTGAVLRKDYGFVDLTTLDSKYAGKYHKSSQIPQETRNAFDDNLFHDATKVSEPGAIRDLLARGFGILSCGSEGFENRRNDDGVSSRDGTWYHAMAVIGFDDRDETHRKYGGPLLLIQNSWAKWNKGPRKIMGTDREIPEGCFWARWKDVRKRNYTALAGVNGWQRKELPNLLGGFV